MQVGTSRLVFLDLCWFEHVGTAAKSRRMGNHLHGAPIIPFVITYLSAATRWLSQGKAMPSPATLPTSTAGCG